MSDVLVFLSSPTYTTMFSVADVQSMSIQCKWGLIGKNKDSSTTSNHYNYSVPLPDWLTDWLTLAVMWSFCFQPTKQFSLPTSTTPHSHNQISHSHKARSNRITRLICSLLIIKFTRFICNMYLCWLRIQCVVRYSWWQLILVSLNIPGVVVLEVDERCDSKDTLQSIA